MKMEKTPAQDNRKTDETRLGSNRDGGAEIIRPAGKNEGLDQNRENSDDRDLDKQLHIVEEGSMELKSDLEIDSLLIPVLDLEQYKPADEKDSGAEDKTQGSVRYAWLGVGRCGSRLVKAFYDLGCSKVLAVDTDKEDLGLLDIPADQKFLMKTDQRQADAGKNMEKGRQAIQQHQQEILHLARKTFSTGTDHIMLCFGAGGSTGGGSIFGLIEVAKRYARYIGLGNPNRSVGVVMTLPACNIGSRPSTTRNAFETATRLGRMASAGKISPLIIIDNNKINTLGPAMGTGSLWSSINENFASLFDAFNRLSARSSPYTSFDPIEYRSIIEAGGCAIMGVTEVSRLDDSFAISEAVKNNLEKTVFAGGFDLSTAQQAGCIVVGGKDLLANIKGLQNNIDYAFDVLSEITGSATIHRGIYEDNSGLLRVYTIIGGLASPAEPLQQLNDRQYNRPSITELEGLPLCERKEDIVPLAEYFLANQAENYGEEQKSLSADAKALLVNYPWPGDVRELAEAMERAYVLSTGPEIACAGLPFEIIFADYEAEHRLDLAVVEQVRSEIIARALALTGGAGPAAAKILGLDAEQLRQFVERL